jgi:two-component system, cell cycle response regulator
MGGRLLVIEDHPANLQLMEYLLHAYGHEVITAATGEDGVHLARSGMFNLIICDVQLPEMDGYGVVDALKRGSPPLTIPMVAVTAFAMAGDRQRLLAAGFDGYIPKPIVPETFVHEIEEFLPARLHGRMRETGTRGRSKTAAGSRTKRPHVIAIDDSPVNLGVLRGILEPHGYDVSLASTVERGLELARAHQPSLIISDIHMPGGDGFELIRAVQEDARLQHVPVALISATVLGSADRKRATREGVADFILRPIEPGDLIARVDSILQRASDDEDPGR